MTNGKKEVQGSSWWTEPCSQREWSEFFPLLVASDVSLPLIWAGTPTSDRPDRSRAAGCLAALAAPTGGVLGDEGRSKARQVLTTWTLRANKHAQGIKDQYPVEDREETSRS